MALLGFDALGRLAPGEVPYSGGPRLLGKGSGTAAFKSARAAVLGATGAGVASFKGAGASRLGASGTGSFAAKGTAGAILSITSGGSFAPVGAAAARLFASGEGSALMYPAGAARLLLSCGPVVTLGGSTAWDRMLETEGAPLAYFAEIEPWVLTDRS
ncbi:hypothetical protein [Bradyrhizobium liaoningense]